MANGSLYGSGSSSGGSLYRGSGATKGSLYGSSSSATAAPHHAGGLTGFIENAGKDVKDATVGFLPGIYHAGDDPVGTFHALAKSYEQTYGHHFLHNFYAHPLGPILDAATVLTLPFGVGEGLAGSRTANALGKAGIIDAKDGALVNASKALGSKYGKVELRGARAILADGGTLKGIGSVVGAESGSVLDRLEIPRVGRLPRRAAAHAIDQLLKQLPAETPLAGEIARFGHALKLLTKRGPRALGMKIGEFQAAIKRLKTPEERIAAHLHLTGTTPAEYAGLLRKAEGELGPSEVRQQMIALVENPELRAAYNSIGTNGRLQHAVESGRAMAAELTKYRINRAVAAHAEMADRVNAEFDAHRDKLGSPAVFDSMTPERMTQVTRAHDAKLADVADRRKAALKANDDDLALTKQLYAERPWLHARLVRGAKFADTYHAPQLAAYDEQIAKLEKQQADLSAKDSEFIAGMKAKGITPKGHLNPHREGLNKVAGNLEKVQAARDRLRKSLITRHAGGDEAAFDKMVNQPQRSRRGIIDTAQSDPVALAKEFEAAGRPAPVYVPDMTPFDAEKGVSVSISRPGGTGAGAFTTDRFAKQNQAELYLSGKIALDPMSLGVAFKDFARRQYLEAIHDELVGSAVWNESSKLPKGWVWIKDNASQRLPRDLAEAHGHGGETVAKLAEEMTDKYSKVSHLMVPERLVSQLTEQFTRSNRFTELLWKKPTTVWRAIILNLRVGWLVNNFVGQHMLLWFHYAGPDMLQAWSSYIRERFGEKSSEFRSFREIEQQYTSQEVYGTQFRSQTPGLDPLDDSVPLASRAGQGFTELTNKAGQLNAKLSEDIPRSIALRTHVIREARKQGVKISTEAHRFNEIADNILSHPHLADKAMIEADRALGDYTTLSDFERRVVRQLVPFYSWFRAITKIVLNSAIDTPGRVAVASRLGQIGEEWVAEQLNNGQPLPDYLKGFVPLLGGAVNTKSASPYGSVADVMDALTALVHGKAGDVGRAITPDLNPYIQSGMEALTGKTAIGGDSLPLPKHFPGGLAGIMGYRNFEELPLARVGIAGAGKAKASKTFGPDTLTRELLNYLGIPFRPKPHLGG